MIRSQLQVVEQDTFTANGKTLIGDPVRYNVTIGFDSSGNSVSSGTTVAAFKGFAEKPTTPTCGTTWSTDPGNSTPPRRDPCRPTWA